MTSHDDAMLRYYLRELGYVRKQGAAFARAYPKVAGRLQLGDGECPDPHVERLVESFAFLTARIQRTIDSDFPEIAAELLDILYPHYTCPIPSLSIARFDVDPGRGLTTGHLVPAHTPLFAHGERDAVCRFRTCYPVTLWPIEVTDAAVVEPEALPMDQVPPGVVAALRLRLVSRGVPLAALNIERLRFHLSGERVVVNELYEVLCNHVTGAVVAMAPEDGGGARGSARPGAAGVQLVRLPGPPIVSVGFGRDEPLLPCPASAHPAYLLLQEYFAFPEKFHFLDLAGLDSLQHAGIAAARAREVDVLLLLDRPLRPWGIDAGTFALGCTPIVNLFPHTSEPVRLDHRSHEYPLIPDHRRRRTTEIHSIQSVSSSSDANDTARHLTPFYSFQHHRAGRGQRVFWHARRVPALDPGLRGTDMLLSFLDLDFRPGAPPGEVVFAHTLCTNRALATQLHGGAHLQTDTAVPATRIVCLRTPTEPVDPPAGGQALWRLVSHLSIGYLSLTDQKDPAACLDSLREMLRLYAPLGDTSAEQQIQGIASMSQRKVVRRLGTGARGGFCRGTRVTIELDERAFVGHSAYLMASVLNRFLALHAAIGSFTELHLQSKQRKGDWTQWRPMAGDTIVP
jgi:type VI secretion system protein ImpG